MSDRDDCCGDFSDRCAHKRLQALRFRLQTSSLIPEPPMYSSASSVVTSSYNHGLIQTDKISCRRQEDDDDQVRS